MYESSTAGALQHFTVFCTLADSRGGIRGKFTPCTDFLGELRDQRRQHTSLPIAQVRGQADWQPKDNVIILKNKITIKSCGAEFVTGTRVKVAQ